MSEEIEIKGSGAGAQFAAALRQMCLVVGGWLAGRGYLEADTVAMLGTVSIILGPAAYGQYKQWKRHMRTVEIAQRADGVRVK